MSMLAATLETNVEKKHIIYSQSNKGCVCLTSLNLTLNFWWYQVPMTTHSRLHLVMFMCCVS